MAIALVVVTSAAGYLAGSRVRSPQDVLADSKPPPATTLTAAVRQGSVGATTTLAGKIEWNSKVVVRIAMSESGLPPVVTGAPRSRGADVRPGAVLVEIADRPVFVLPGAVPMLRDLHVGDRGDDVKRLQEGLRNAGYNPGAVDGVFGTSTRIALDAMYADAGYAPPTAPATSTEQADNEAGHQAGQEAPPGRPQARASTYAYAARSEIAFVTTLPAVLMSYAVRIGGTVQDEIATLGAGGLVVRANAPAAWAQRLHSSDGTSRGGGVRVRVELADGRSSRGVLSQVGAPRVVEGEGSVVPVTVQIRDSGLSVAAGSEASVTLTDRRAPSGLLVPLAALYSSADLGDYVSVKHGSRPERIPVRVVATGNGAAVVEPRGEAALAVGDQVVVGVDQAGQ